MQRLYQEMYHNEDINVLILEEELDKECSFQTIISKWKY